MRRQRHTGEQTFCRNNLDNGFRSNIGRYRVGGVFFGTNNATIGSTR